MIKTTKEIYCDLCGKQIKNTYMSVSITFHEQDFSGSFVGGYTKKYNDICYRCRNEIEKVIDMLHK